MLPSPSVRSLLVSVAPLALVASAFAQTVAECVEFGPGSELVYKGNARQQDDKGSWNLPFEVQVVVLGGSENELALFHSLEQARGSMNLKRCPDPRGFERANYVQVLQSWRFE